MCFINGHYELFVDATAQAGLKYESIIFKQDFKTSNEETIQKSPPSKTQHSLQFFSSTQRLKLSAEQQDLLTFLTLTPQWLGVRKMLWF